MQLRQVVAALEILLLAADHRQRRIDQLARNVGAAQEREADRLDGERVAREDRRRLAVGRPHAWLPSALLVVVERRQVVVNERERMHELDGGRGREHPLEIGADRLGARQAEDRTHALAAERVAVGLDERAENRRGLVLGEVALDQLPQLVRRPRHRPPPPGARSAAPPRSAW